MDFAWSCLIPHEVFSCDLAVTSIQDLLILCCLQADCYSDSKSTATTRNDPS
jgi:hypothetical protein